MRQISNTDIHDFGTTFRAYRSEYLKKVELFGDMHRFIPALLSRFGGRITEIHIQNIARPMGKSNYNRGDAGQAGAIGEIAAADTFVHQVPHQTAPLRYRQVGTEVIQHHRQQQQG